MGEKGVGKLSRETPPPCEGEPMGAVVTLGATHPLGRETRVVIIIIMSVFLERLSM